MQDVWQYAINTQSKMNELCKPLEELGIKFVYDKIFFNNTYLTLVNHDSPFLQYCKILRSAENLLFNKPNQIFLSEVFSVPTGQLGHYLWPTCMFGVPLLDFITHYDIYGGISFFQRKIDYVECWSFFISNYYEQPELFLLNNINFLKQFILYFNQNNKDLINNSIMNKLLLSKVAEEYLTTIIQSTIGAKKKFEELNIKRYKIYDEYLKNDIVPSKREIECLYNLSIGKSIKEVSTALGISDRTIETHFNNIKIKSGLNTRSQLISLYLNSDINIIR